MTTGKINIILSIKKKWYANPFFVYLGIKLGLPVRLFFDTEIKPGV